MQNEIRTAWLSLAAGCTASAWSSVRRPGVRASYLSVFLLLATLPVPVLATVGPEVGWEPSALPAGTQGPVQVKELVIDNSGSVAARTKPSRVRAAARHAVAAIQDGTYVIIASFGTTAHVAADRFVLTKYDRQLLVDAIEGIALDASHTDVAVLENLIAAVRAGLARRFAAEGFRLEVEIFTDGRADPVPKRRGSVPRQSFDRLLGQSPTKTSLGDGLFVLALAFEQASAPTSAGVAVLTPYQATTASPSVGAPTPALFRHVESSPAAAGSSAVWQYGGVTVVALLFAFLAFRHLKRTTGIDIDAENIPDPIVAELPDTLIVIEQEKIDGERAVIRESERIAIVSDAPVIFGTDAASCTYLTAPVHGMENSEFFRITQTRGGMIHLKAAPGVLCNEKAVPQRGLAFQYEGPMRIQLVDREWIVTVSSERDQPASIDSLFERIHGSAQAAHRVGG